MAKRVKDNSTIRQKIMLRQAAMQRIDNPVLMETHGGIGQLYKACYRSVQDGVVFEKNSDKAAVLGRQRPTWAVYEADCVNAVKEGAGAHLEVNFLDVDPYGNPWPVIDAFFNSTRPRPEKLLVVVHDGLRHKVKVTGGWDVLDLAKFVERWGNDLYPIYLNVCRELMIEKAVQANYSLDRWAGFHSGKSQDSTHYLAVLKR